MNKALSDGPRQNLVCSELKVVPHSPQGSTRKEMKISHGWLEGFKKRCDIKSYCRHGEAASDGITDEVREKINALKAVIKTYHPEDMFNMDETSSIDWNQIECLQHVIFLERAWRINVSAKTMRKSWSHSQLVTLEEILPDLNDPSIPDMNAPSSDGIEELRSTLQRLGEASIASEDQMVLQIFNSKFFCFLGSDIFEVNVLNHTHSRQKTEERQINHCVYPLPTNVLISQLH
ncbi:hypothetical protein R1sor_017353 [Riccia sorocarpa]|uniref:HTH CENPB-type domain-containing protein n=1 Tax=Riccia sorocarpa TaxID=122646 RepID=A0ABD3I7P5_9MARC